MEAKDQNHIGLLFDRLFTGSLSGSEKSRLRAYIRSTFQDQRLNALMEKHWNSLADVNSARDERELQDIKVRIRSLIMNENTASHQPVRKSLPLRMNYLVRAAAVLTVPLLILSGYLWYRLNQRPGEIAGQAVVQQVIATPGSRVRFVLPDQSEVWLNSGSSLEFTNDMYARKQRRVKLHGQGYFHVSKDEEHPFIVETGEMNIKVLGTSFDVSNYADDEFISSTLEEGAIVLLNATDKKMACLRPGQQAVFNKQTTELKINQVNTRLATSWKDGTLIFRNSSLKEVTRQLERWFNCTIHVDPGLIHSNILYTATIQEETLGEVLKMIEISTPVKTKVKNREVTIWPE